MDRPKLTIGLPHVNDFEGLYFTVQALRLYQDLRGVEIVIVDNSPEGSKVSKEIEGISGWWFSNKEWLAEKGAFPAKYIRMTDPVGTAVAKNRVFEEATGEVVLCMDCHVLLQPGAVQKIIQWFADNPGCKDLITGPLLYDTLTGISTHFADVWRGEMWGIWSQAWEKGSETRFCTGERDGHLVYYSMEAGVGELSPESLNLPALDFSFHEQKLRELGCYQLGWEDTDDFAVPGQGCGLFACRKDAWLGFNPLFRGFGGEEMYINEKFRQAGNHTRCLGFLKWLHRFHRPNGVPYPVWMEDKVRNYIIGMQELGLPTDKVKEFFVDTGLVPRQNYEIILADPLTPINHRRSSAEVALPPESLEAYYFQQHNTKGDLNEHMPKLRALAEQVDRVVEFSHRKDSFLAFASGARVSFTSYNSQVDELLSKVNQPNPINIAHSPKSDLGPPQETDLLFLDTTHTFDFVHTAMTKWAAHVSRYIVLHDTVSYGERGEDAKDGLRYAVKQFIEDKPEWCIAFHTDKQHGLTVLSKNPEDCPTNPIRIWDFGNGPGSELKAIMKSLGVHPSPTCDCNRLAKEMDRMGPDKCEEEIQNIVNSIKGNADRWGWGEAIGNRVKMGINIFKHPGLLLKLGKKPTDPITVLVTEAIRRAKEKEGQELASRQGLIDLRKEFNEKRGE